MITQLIFERLFSFYTKTLKSVTKCYAKTEIDAEYTALKTLTKKKQNKQVSKSK